MSGGATHDTARSLADIEDRICRAYLEEALINFSQLIESLHLTTDIPTDLKGLRSTWALVERQYARSEISDDDYRISFAKHTRRALELLANLKRELDAGPKADDAAPSPTRPALDYRKPDSAQVPLTLVCKDITKHYRRKVRLKNVSFELRPGEVLGVVGANGSGKTTLLRILAGELSHDFGEVRLGDHAMGTQAYVQRVAYVSQRTVPWPHSVTTHLQWHAALAGTRSLEDNAQHVEEVLTWLQLSEHREKKFNELSEGQRMRVAIAVATLARPTLLILDEPLAPLDPSSQLNLLGWLRRHTREWRGLMSVISSQHVPEIELVADRTLLLRDGSPAAEASTRADKTVYEITPQNDHASFEALRRQLEKLRERRIISKVVPCEQYALLAFLETPLELDEFASHLREAQPRMLRDVSKSARRMLLREEPD